MHPRDYLKMSMLVLLPLLFLLVMTKLAKSEQPDCHTDTECGCIEECL